MSSYVRQSLRIKPPFGEEGDPPLPPDAKVLYEEDFWLVPNQIPNVQQINQMSNMQQMNQAQYIQQMNYESNNQQINFDESFVQTDEQSLPKKRSKNELAHADFIERLIVGKITFLSYPESEVISYRFIWCIKGAKDICFIV
jgi:DNA-directed RNA polymerase specialized sigma subunit